MREDVAVGVEPRFHAPHGHALDTSKKFVDLGTLRHEDEDTTTCRAGGGGRLLRGLRLDVILRVYLPRVGGARGAWRPLWGRHRE